MLELDPFDWLNRDLLVLDRFEKSLRTNWGPCLVDPHNQRNLSNCTSILWRWPCHLCAYCKKFNFLFPPSSHPGNWHSRVLWVLSPGLQDPSSRTVTRKHWGDMGDRVGTLFLCSPNDEVSTSSTGRWRLRSTNAMVWSMVCPRGFGFWVMVTQDDLMLEPIRIGLSTRIKRLKWMGPMPPNVYYSLTTL
jgi:hypothetical protein